MRPITIDEAQSISGSGFWLDYTLSKIIDYTIGAVASGKVDYAGVAASQGTYYNTVGA